MSCLDDRSADRSIGLQLGVVWLLCLVTLWTIACTRVGPPPVTPIVEILSDPRGYDGRIVRIEGEVRGAANLFLVRYFTVADDTGDIVVLTDRAVPVVGQPIRVRGRVEQYFAFAGWTSVVLKEDFWR